MNLQFYLHLADVRLLQTLGLLRNLPEEHQGHEALDSAVEAISTARNALKSIMTA